MGSEMCIRDSGEIAPAGNQTRVSSVAGTYTITVLPAHVFVLGFEPRISRVLGERHNQARPYEH